MTRLHFLVEGPTEESFVNELLVGPLSEKGVYADARCVFTSRRKNQKGGVVSYKQVKGDLDRWMKEDPTANFTTMLDLYALPKDFPGWEHAEKTSDLYQKATAIQNAFKADVGSVRFTPYIQLHEFEGLLFSDSNAFSLLFPDKTKNLEMLFQETACFDTPEHINEHRETAPSKRLAKHLPAYRKTTHGPMLAFEMGLDVIRQKCLHFNKWVSAMEQLAGSD